MRFFDAIVWILSLYIVYYGVLLLYDVVLRKNISTKRTEDGDSFEVYEAPQSIPIKPNVDDYLPQGGSQKKN